MKCGTRLKIPHQSRRNAWFYFFIANIRLQSVGVTCMCMKLICAKTLIACGSIPRSGSVLNPECSSQPYRDSSLGHSRHRHTPHTTMDSAYDHIQEESYPQDPTKQQPGAGTTSQTASNLSAEVQDAYKAISSSPWAASLGGLWGTVKKQVSRLQFHAIPT